MYIEAIHGSRNSVFVLLDKGLPRGITLLLFGLSAIEKVADSYGQPIGSIKVRGELFEFEQLLQHLGYLFLGGISIASDGHLHFLGFVFGNRQIASQSRRHGHSLGTPQFKHGLYILSEKGGFYGQLIWVIGVYKLGSTLEYVLELEVVIVVLAQ